MKYAVYFSLACLLAVGLADINQTDVTYIFYSRENFDGVVVHYDENPGIRHVNQVFNPQLPTVLLIHGWQDNFEAGSNTYIRAAILSKINANVIKVDWSPLSRQGYFAARDSVPSVGRFAAKLVAELSETFNYPLSNVYLVGFSLGAHIAGNIGKKFNGEIGVIVALDPAGPFIESSDVNFSVHPTDARYVQSIHTNGGTLGMSDAVGHSDFYPNGGSRQPGCGLDLVGACSHNRAWALFAESISNNKFVGISCTNWSDFRSGICSGDHRVMGGLTAIDKNATGTFFLETNSNEPFGRG